MSRGRPSRAQRQKRSAHDVKDIVKLKESLIKCGSPFQVGEDDNPRRVVHLTTGVEAPDEVAESLLGWREHGETAAGDFIKLIAGKDRTLPFAHEKKQA